MKKIFLGIIFLYFLPSCNDKTFYQLQIVIKNDTKGQLNIILFPKKAYMMGDLYDYGIGGGFRGTVFNINSGDESYLFSTENLKIEPTTLITQVFDSILVNSTDGNIKIKFFPSNVTGYPFNLYVDSSKWTFEIKNFDLRTMFKRNPVESHDYIFTIINQ